MARAAPASARASLPGRWRHQVHVDHLQPEAGDPLHEPGESSLIGQLSAKGRGARADGDLTVLELRPQRGTRLAGEGDLVYLWSHQGHASAVCWFSVPPACLPAEE